MCKICRMNPCNPSCPNYSPIYSEHMCRVCGGNISEGSSYVDLLDGYAHYDCLIDEGVDYLLKELEINVKIKEDD